MANSSPKSPQGLAYAALSDIGLRRSNNQDSYSVVLANTAETYSSRGHLFLVADGMGAHAAGELASKIAADTIPQTYRKHVELSPADALLNAIAEANSTIHNRGEANAEFHGMGTTASVLLLLPQGALVGHVGDSRVYRLRGQQFEQLTFDHSLVWEMMSSAQLAGEEPPANLPKNIITRSLGPAIRVDVDREGPFPLQPGDTFLLCSDGLSGQLNDDELGQLLLTLPPAEAAQAMIDLANLRGGPDNITLIIVRVEQPELAAPAVRSAPAQKPPASAGRWVFIGLAGIALLATALFGWAKIWVATAMGGLAAVVFAILAIFGSRETNGYEDPPTTVYYGKGPHRSVGCAPSREFVDRLAEVTRQLQQAAVDEGWQVDWNRFRTLVGQAESARDASRPAESLRDYARAMSFMMHELRQQRSKPA